jgi:DNA invertase Pin-like site-specific DNA recombinase
MQTLQSSVRPAFTAITWVRIPSGTPKWILLPRGTATAQRQNNLSVVGAFVESERSLIKERQREGIALAKAKGGVYRGRVPSLTADKVKDLLSRIAAGESKAQLARDFGISRASVCNYAPVS